MYHCSPHHGGAQTENSTINELVSRKKEASNRPETPAAEEQGLKKVRNGAEGGVLCKQQIPYTGKCHQKDQTWNLDQNEVQIFTVWVLTCYTYHMRLFVFTICLKRLERERLMRAAEGAVLLFLLSKVTHFTTRRKAVTPRKVRTSCRCVNTHRCHNVYVHSSFPCFNSSPSLTCSQVAK